MNSESINLMIRIACSKINPIISLSYNVILDVLSYHIVTEISWKTNRIRTVLVQFLRSPDDDRCIGCYCKIGNDLEDA